MIFSLAPLSLTQSLDIIAQVDLPDSFRYSHSLNANVGVAFVRNCLRWLIAGGAATDSMMRRATEPRRVESEKNVGSTEVMQMYDMI